jgi:hypothetical protein
MRAFQASQQPLYIHTVRFKQFCNSLHTSHVTNWRFRWQFSSDSQEIWRLLLAKYLSRMPLARKKTVYIKIINHHYFNVTNMHDQLHAHSSYWRLHFLRRAARPQAVRTVNLMRFNGTNWRLQTPTREASKCYQLSAIVKYEVSLRKNRVDCQENSGPTE